VQPIVGNAGRKSPDAAEEKTMEISLVETRVNKDEQVTVLCAPLNSQILATRLLDAWIAGDYRRLDYELRPWKQDDFHAGDEDDRLEVLRSLVEQMAAEPDLFAPRAEKLHLGVWIDLLEHLAKPERATGVTYGDL
jgi:hypothetical protein